MKDDWKSQLNFKEKKISKGSNPSLYYILVHKPYKLSATEQAKMIVPETVTASSEKNTPNSRSLVGGKSHHMLSATTDNTMIEIEKENDNDGSSSIEASPDHDVGAIVESVVEENTRTESGGWEENVKKNEENMEREERLMLGESEWTLNAKLEESTSINGKRGFEYYEQLRSSKKPTPVAEEEEEEEEVEVVEKRVKREEGDYQKLVERLHELDQDEIIEIAKGLDNAGRDAIIQLLMQAEKDADASEDTHTENQRLISILTPTKEMKKSNDPIIIIQKQKTPPVKVKKESVTSNDPIIIQKPATPSSMLNLLNHETSPYKIGGSPHFGDNNRMRSIGNLLNAPLTKIPSASKSESAYYKRSIEDKQGSKSVENKIGDSHQPFVFPDFLNLQSAPVNLQINEGTFGFNGNQMIEETNENVEMGPNELDELVGQAIKLLSKNLPPYQ